MSTVGDIMSTVGDILSTVGGYSVLWEISLCMWGGGDIMNTMRGVQYRGG